MVKFRTRLCTPCTHCFKSCHQLIVGQPRHMKGFRAESRFAPSQWETVLLCNDASHWLGANQESARAFTPFRWPLQCPLGSVGLGNVRKFLQSECLCSLWRHQIETLLTLLMFCEKNPPVTAEFSSQRASDAELWCYLCCYAENPLNKQSSCRWFGKMPMWRLCNIKALHFWPFNREFDRWPVDSPHKSPITQRAFLCHDIIINRR